MSNEPLLSKSHVKPGMSSASTLTPSVSGWKRVAMSIERVQQRLQRSTAALAAAEIPYAVIGGNAVAEWVGRVDEGAVRFTKDVDILLNRSDLHAAIEALSKAGFVHHHSFGVDMFLDSPDAKPSEAVHVIFAAEKVKDSDPTPTPSFDEVESDGDISVVSLEALVRMKLTSYRRKDQTHLDDMIGVGLMDVTWVNRYPSPLSERLQALFDTPEG